MRIFFKELADTLYPVIWGFIFNEDRAPSMFSRPADGIEFSRPVTGIFSLVKIGNFEYYSYMYNGYINSVCQSLE